MLPSSPLAGASVAFAGGILRFGFGGEILLTIRFGFRFVSARNLNGCRETGSVLPVRSGVKRARAA
jgi:hypothetical protein